MSWRAVDVERLIGEDHRARAIWALVGRLDLKRFYEGIESSAEEGGRPAFDPQLLISLWVYAYSEGIGSAREVARRCEFDPAFQWLTGLEEVNYHTLAVFVWRSSKSWMSCSRRCWGAQQGRLDHAGAGDAGRDEDQGAGKQQELSAGRNDSGAPGAGAAACGRDGRSPERRDQSKSKASAGPSAAGTTPAAGERAGRVTEATGGQEGRESQEPGRA